MAAGGAGHRGESEAGVGRRRVAPAGGAGGGTHGGRGHRRASQRGEFASQRGEFAGRAGGFARGVKHLCARASEHVHATQRQREVVRGRQRNGKARCVAAGGGVAHAAGKQRARCCRTRSVGARWGASEAEAERGCVRAAAHARCWGGWGDGNATLRLGEGWLAAPRGAWRPEGVEKADEPTPRGLQKWGRLACSPLMQAFAAVGVSHLAGLWAATPFGGVGSSSTPLQPPPSAAGGRPASSREPLSAAGGRPLRPRAPTGARARNFSLRLALVGGIGLTPWVESAMEMAGFAHWPDSFVCARGAGSRCSRTSRAVSRPALKLKNPPGEIKRTGQRQPDTTRQSPAKTSFAKNQKKKKILQTKTSFAKNQKREKTLQVFETKMSPEQSPRKTKRTGANADREMCKR